MTYVKQFYWVQYYFQLFWLWKPISLDAWRKETHPNFNALTLCFNILNNFFLAFEW